MTPVYKQISHLIALKTSILEWTIKHERTLESIMGTAPSGSGIDDDVIFDLENSTPESLIFSIPYHHMNSDGYYDGWSEYTLTITPSLRFAFELDFRAEHPREEDEYVLDHLYEIFRDWLLQSVDREGHLHQKRAVPAGLKCREKRNLKWEST